MAKFIRLVSHQGPLTNGYLDQSDPDPAAFGQGAWANLMSQQNATLSTMGMATREGLAAAGEGNAVGQRLHEMQDFYSYMSDQLVPLIEQWRQQYKANHG